MPMSCLSRILPFALLLLSCGGVQAENLNLLVSLQLQSTQLNLNYPSGERTTDVNSLDFIWDETLTPWLDGGLKLGLLDITQSSNPIPAGQSASGDFIGMGLRFHLYRGDRLHLFTDIDYQYNETSSDLPNQRVELRWHQLSAQPVFGWWHPDNRWQGASERHSGLGPDIQECEIGIRPSRRQNWT
jgi:hypothetical protein